MAGDDDMAQEVARRLRISTRKSTRSSCVIVLLFGAGLLLRTFVGLVANRAADHSSENVIDPVLRLSNRENK